jgi:DNA-binding SARP family transcriptional activator
MSGATLEAEVAPLRVFLTGRLRVEGAETVVDEASLPGRQARLAFVFLVAERLRVIEPVELAHVVWSKGLPAAWQPALRSVLTKVRGFLGAAGLPGPTTLHSDFGCYRLLLPEDAIVDLDVAATSMATAERALSSGDPAAACAPALAAYAVAGRAFLVGETGEWVDAQRRWLASVGCRALEALGESHLALGETHLAQEAAAKLVALEPLHESGHRLLMRAHAAGGNRGDALQAYERCRRLLSRELHVEPSMSTRAALLAVRAER